MLSHAYPTKYFGGNMSYKRADKILPMKLIREIQAYVEGENIYIPKIEGNRRSWGERTSIKQELLERNLKIVEDYHSGLSVLQLAEKYFLSDKSIQRIIRNTK